MFEPQLATKIREQIQTVFTDGRIVPRHTEHQHFYEDTVDGELYASVTTKTSLLSREHYKQMAADKAVDHIMEKMVMFSDMEPEQITEVFSYARQAHVHDLKRAGTWGTHGHDVVDRYVSAWIEHKDRPLDIKDFVVSEETSNEGICAALSASKFFDDYTLFPIVSEKKIVSKKHKYAGTLDSLWCVGEVFQESHGDGSCRHNWFDKSHDKVACGLCGRVEKLSIMLGDWKTSNSVLGKHEYLLQISFYANALKEMCGVIPKKYWIVRLDKKSPHYEIVYLPDIKTATEAALAMNQVYDFTVDKEQALRPLRVKQIITL